MADDRYDEGLVHGHDWAREKAGPGVVPAQVILKPAVPADEPYDDGLHTGVWEIFTDCGGSATFVVVGANDISGSYTVVVAAQAIGDADLEAVDRVLGSFYAFY